MGCFLACFGSSKDRKKRNRQRHKVQPRDNRNASFKQAQPNVSVPQNNPEIPTVVPVSDTRVQPERQYSLSPRKKVTFDSNVTTHEHISVGESTDFSVEKEDGDKSKEKEEENLTKQSQSQSTSEDSSTTSSLGSYPSNHRYQNCRDSDDELEYGESDVDDDEEDDEDDGVSDYDDTHGDAEKLGSRCISPVPVTSLHEKEVKPNPNARDRSAYVHSVLNPVENLTQWKAVKAKGTPPLKQQKENLTMNQEPQFSFSSEPGFREKSDQQSKKSDHEIAVDASLSNWLGSSERTPVNRPSSTGLGTTTPEKSRISTGSNMGSNSPKSFDDRPILGALTVEEIKQFSTTSSPKRSPSRSPDEMPIIGTVGTFWNHNVSCKDSDSAASFKGIPNTTSKYREDMRVNWHSTPFETRLERALNGTGAC